MLHTLPVVQNESGAPSHGPLLSRVSWQVPKVLPFELLLCQSSSMKATMPVCKFQALEVACMQEQQQN